MSRLVCPAGTQSAQALMVCWRLFGPDLPACWGRLCLVPASRLWPATLHWNLTGTQGSSFPEQQIEGSAAAWLQMHTSSFPWVQVCA